MKCPHCLVEFHDNSKYIYIGQDSNGGWGIRSLWCPNPKCKKHIFYLANGRFSHISGNQHGISIGETKFIVPPDTKETLVRPKGITRTPPPVEVPQEFVEDYMEACLILSDSPKASAALSRRCLQHILREKGDFKGRTLDAEIQMALDSKTLPPYISESIDAVRNIGNFAAHPIKSQQTGEILPVEPEEAEWNLEVIEMLFDFYFVQPEKTRLKKESVNQKLQEAGKPAMK